MFFIRLPILSPEKMFLEIPDWLAKSQNLKAASQLILIDDSAIDPVSGDEKIEVFFIKEKRIRKFSKVYSKIIDPALNKSLESFA